MHPKDCIQFRCTCTMTMKLFIHSFIQKCSSRINSSDIVVNKTKCIWILINNDLLKPILSKICPGDCFMSLDLKDHFHIQVAPHHRLFLIHIRRGGISIQGPAVWAVSGSPHFYTMHGYGSLPSETDGNPYTQLPRRLAHSGPVAGGFDITQRPSSSAT